MAAVCAGRSRASGPASACSRASARAASKAAAGGTTPMLPGGTDRSPPRGSATGARSRCDDREAPAQTGQEAGMDLGVRGRGYLLVGGTSGMGLATAKVMAAEGADLVLVGRD